MFSFGTSGFRALFPVRSNAITAFNGCQLSDSVENRHRSKIQAPSCTIRPSCVFRTKKVIARVVFVYSFLSKCVSYVEMRRVPRHNMDISQSQTQVYWYDGVGSEWRCGYQVKTLFSVGNSTHKRQQEPESYYNKVFHLHIQNMSQRHQQVLS